MQSLYHLQISNFCATESKSSKMNDFVTRVVRSWVFFPQVMKQNFCIKNEQEHNVCFLPHQNILDVIKYFIVIQKHSQVMQLKNMTSYKILHFVGKPLLIYSTYFKVNFICVVCFRVNIPNQKKSDDFCLIFKTFLKNEI